MEDMILTFPHSVWGPATFSTTDDSSGYCMSVFLYMCVFSRWIYDDRGWEAQHLPVQIDLNPYHSPQQQHKTPQFCPVWLGSAETCKPWGGLFAFCVSMLRGKLQTRRRLDPPVWNLHLFKVHPIWRITFIISNWCNIPKILIILYIQVLSRDSSCIKRTRCSVIIFLLKENNFIVLWTEVQLFWLSCFNKRPIHQAWLSTCEVIKNEDLYDVDPQWGRKGQAQVLWV